MSVDAAARQDLAERVLATIAEVTRYPRSILRPEAELEDELGIESVKRAEILGVLGERLKLRPPEEGSLGQLKTIGDLIAAVEHALAAQAGAALPPPVTPAAPSHTASLPVAATAASPDGLEELVIATIAEVTRYPRGVLRPEAELEDELGIEFVKRAEILGALGTKLGIPPPEDGVLSGLKTIGDVVAAARALAGGRQPLPGPAAAPVPVAPPRAPDPPPLLVSTVALGNNGSFDRPPALVTSRAAAVSAEPFAGKVALVTGSGRGLGKVIAEHLARLGASVVVNSFHSPEQGAATASGLVADGRDAIHAWGSVASPEQLDEVLHAVEGRFGHLDFLVWNASDARVAPLAALTPEDWSRAFRTDVVGFHRAAFRAAALMAGRGGGKIVSITHPASQRCFEALAVLGTVKAALESLTRYLAIELGPANIQVNSVLAGPCHEHLDRYPGSERLVPKWKARTPGGQLPGEAAVAHAVAFLLSPDSSRMTGSIVTVDAGVLLST